jgi:hypothetical protein
MEKNIICVFDNESEKKEAVVIYDNHNLSERIFEKMDFEIDSIMRKL